MDKENMLVPKRRKKLTVATNYTVYPPTTGAPLRVFHLYKNLSRWFDIELITYSGYGNKLNNMEICPGFWEISVPKSYEHYKAEIDIYEKMGSAAYDYSQYNLHHLSPEYLSQLEKSSIDSELVICSEPYCFPAVIKLKNKRIWYDAHNVEYELKKSLIVKDRNSDQVLKQIKYVEEKLCKVSELIMACSTEDKKKISSLYTLNSDKILVVPNGTDTDNIKFVLPSVRNEVRNKYKINNNTVAFFIGAYYSPNIMAVEQMVKMAMQLPEVHFIVSGSVCNYFRGKRLPSNVKLTGWISDKQKALLLSYADIALNPITHGSGTNLKILEYFAYGIPVITTPMGARGFSVQNDRHCKICEIYQFPRAIIDLKGYSLESKDKLATNAREYVESEFNWRVLGEKTYEYIRHNNLI